ncbi:uridine kinase family protein [Peribacillus simplex]|uniref:uridine kinase family protein n=1 Tax=Peribacillus simplex TaxID=1478 RepID=UPI0024C0FF4E|nr:NB-ARC domain-containing protein [Peribacillus simplex]WHY98135.1 NB-ARC domain-containing protein [Peribacillus simplex]
MNFPTLDGQYTISSLIAEIHEISKKRSPYILAIDGRGGSGKSTLASSIQAECPGSAVVHMDDFYLPSSDRVQLPPFQKQIGADYDWERVFNQILKPLTNRRDAKYQRYDWKTDTMAEWHDVPAEGLVIIEGTYSIRKELAGYHDFTIWVDCPRDQRLKRGIERDGEEARQMWEDNWMVYEDLYVGAQMPQERANLVVDGTS